MEPHYPQWRFVGTNSKGLDEYVCKVPGCERRVALNPKLGGPSPSAH